jgi:hypothetical protein
VVQQVVLAVLVLKQSFLVEAEAEVVVLRKVAARALVVRVVMVEIMVAEAVAVVRPVILLHWVVLALKA